MKGLFQCPRGTEGVVKTIEQAPLADQNLGGAIAEPTTSSRS